MILVISVTKCKEQRYSSFSWKKFAAEHFRSNPGYGNQASITVQKMLPPTFRQHNLGKMTIRALLYHLGLCFLYSQPVYYGSLTSEKTRERSPVYWNTSSLVDPSNFWFYNTFNTVRSMYCMELINVGLSTRGGWRAEPWAGQPAVPWSSRVRIYRKTKLFPESVFSKLFSRWLVPLKLPYPWLLFQAVLPYFFFLSESVSFFYISESSSQELC